MYKCIDESLGPIIEVKISFFPKLPLNGGLNLICLITYYTSLLFFSNILELGEISIYTWMEYNFQTQH